MDELPSDNNAEFQVTFADVQLRSIVITPEQLTRSVLRQLDIEPIIEVSTMQLRGRPWGRVPCFGRHARGMSTIEHLHVVWQKGYELRHAWIPREPSQDPAIRDHLKSLRHRWSSFAQIGAALAALEAPPSWSRASADGRHQMSVGAWTIEVDPDEKALTEQVWDLRSDEHVERQRQAATGAIRRLATDRWRWLHHELMPGVMPLLSEPIILGACQYLERQTQQWCERWRTRYRELSTLVQLPITR